jgi:hypothetical protein
VIAVTKASDREEVLRIRARALAGPERCPKYHGFSHWLLLP